MRQSTQRKGYLTLILCMSACIQGKAKSVFIKKTKTLKKNQLRSLNQIVQLIFINLISIIFKVYLYNLHVLVLIYLNAKSVSEIFKIMIMPFEFIS